MEVPRSEKPVGATSATTFRISEIPISLLIHELLEIVKGVLSTGDGDDEDGIVILNSSLAPSPSDQNRFQTATVTFLTLPTKLNFRNGGHLRIEITVGNVPTYICFDRHFFGLTPLNDGVSPGYTVE